MAFQVALVKTNECNRLLPSSLHQRRALTRVLAVMIPPFQRYKEGSPPSSPSSFPQGQAAMPWAGSISMPTPFPSPWLGLLSYGLLLYLGC